MTMGTRVSYLSPLQRQVDDLVGQFAGAAFDVKSLAAFTAGGLAYRAGRLALTGKGTPLLRALSVASGLGTEVSAFELTHRGLSSAPVGAQGRAPLHSHLWRWSGPQGLKQGLLQSFLTLGALKGAARAAQGENFFLRQFFQDSAIVATHHLSGALSPALKPRGTLTEQFLHAQAATFQVGAGMLVAHRLLPRLTALERGWDLQIPAAEGKEMTRRTIAESFLSPQPAWAGIGGQKPPSAPSEAKGPDLFFIQGRRASRPGGTQGSVSYPLMGAEKSFVENLYVGAEKKPPKFISQGNVREVYGKTSELLDRPLLLNDINRDVGSRLLRTLDKYFSEDIQAVRTTLHPLDLSSDGNGVYFNLPKTGYPLFLGRESLRPFVRRGFLTDVSLISISRKHAEIFLDPDTGRPLLKDLGSKNGTYLNGELILPWGGFELFHGNNIILGGLLFLTIASKEAPFNPHAS